MDNDDLENIIKFGLTIPHFEDVIAAARAGDLGPARDARTLLSDGRNKSLQALNVPGIQPEMRAKVGELLNESRASEQRLDTALRNAADDRHADRMADLAASSNVIAERAEVTAQALVRVTKVLVGATVVLALATIALVVATFALVNNE